VGKDSAYFERVLTGLQQAAELSRKESEPEEALRHCTRIARAVMGDLDAGKRPGALKEGERDFKVSGIFFAAPKRDHLILLADHDFPGEQRHLRISIMDSRPGHTVRTGQPVVVPNTDKDQSFRQILKTARMGSAVYAPMIWNGTVLGMFNIAAQARDTYDTTDLQVGMAFANLASATWMALDGPAYLAGLASSLGPWNEAGVSSPPKREDVSALEAKLAGVLDGLRAATNGSRTTLRLDDVSRGWSVEYPLAESLGSDAPTMKSDLSIHHRSAATARWLERNKQILVQPDLTNSDPPGPWALVNVFNVKAQMLGPILRDDGHVLGWVSVHYMHKPYPIGEADVAAMASAIAEIRQIIGIGSGS
jgi:putative methionine-R-sulfoxide reductase with GAF domain